MQERLAQKKEKKIQAHGCVHVYTEPEAGQTIGRRCIYIPTPAGGERSRSQSREAAESQVESEI